MLKSDIQAAPRETSWYEERRYYTWIVLVQAFLYPLAIITFGERFRWRDHALSDLGSPVTPAGADNFVSAALFSLMLASIALIMASYARFCSKRTDVALSRMKRYIASLCAVGAVIAISPNDRMHTLHVAGCATMIGSFWIFGLIVTKELLLHRLRLQAVTVQVLLEVTILPYAFAFFIDSSNKQILQKPAIVGLVASIWLASRFLANKTTLDVRNRLQQTDITPISETRKLDADVTRPRRNRVRREAPDHPPEISR